MKFVVCVKQVADVPGYVDFRPDGLDIDAAAASRQLNEADSYAMEEALRLGEESDGSEVVVVTVGDDTAEEVLRQCLAMGADRAVRVWSEDLNVHDPIAIGRALAVAARAEAADLVLVGVQSSDSAHQSTGPALASALGLPAVSVATKVELSDVVTIHREFEGGLSETVEVSRPAVVSIQTGLNTPRYGSFKEKMRAKKAEIPVIDPGAAAATGLRVRRMFVPETTGGHVEMISGGPAEIAAQIIQIVREVGR